MFSDSRPGEVEVSEAILALLSARHDQGVHVADLCGGAAIALCAMMDTYGRSAPAFLRGLAERYETDPFTSAIVKSRARD